MKRTPPRHDGITQTGLARLAGVSQKTVHLALTGASGVHPETGARILALARKHAYRLNAAASAMRSRSTRFIGLAIRPMPNEPPTQVSTYESILGVDDVLAEAGYLSCLVRMTDIPVTQRSRVFHERLLDGVIVVNQVPRRLREPIGRAAGTCVWMESDVWMPTHCIRRDEQWAGGHVVEQLAPRVRRLLWIGDAPGAGVRNMPGHFSKAHRLQGVRKAAARHGLPLTEWPSRGAGLSFDEAVADVTVSPPAALLAYNSVTAIAVYARLARRGWIAGRDYSLASFDSIVRDDVYLPGLARITFDRHALGKDAARMMLASLRGETDACASRLVRGEWIAGTTLCGSAPGASHA